ncbi:hypothetical protein J3B02_002987 [Coemansia erecta]|uniref:AB hydrolase-1 domain-containing protein n=1 Tax=Coemansia asiatica TaxID=1052880 RepID=A0A9W7XK27_9FUNG|nr:hypothetical protein LPJ64_003972 [Coemansia asiatica]KAJ2853767.1 hypothetical protein J3B02_002987 [Coemansia erecta]KAJ2878582.1 hypothetical protein FB639_003339 [Coemansia asiatica]
MLIDTFELAIFVPSRLDGRALEAVVTFTVARPYAPTDTDTRAHSDAPANQPVDSNRAIVFLHPYAPLGGRFQNKVIADIDSHLGRRVALTVAFNLRGAGRSEGRTSWTGVAEQEDLRSILDMLSSRKLLLHPDRHPAAARRSLLLQMQARGFLDANADVDALDGVPLPSVASTLLCGYSYGAMISAAIAPTEYPLLAIDYAHISYPYGVVWALALHKRSWYLQRIADSVAAAAAAHAAGAEHASRTLFVAGTCDSYTSIAAYSRWWDQLWACAVQAVTSAVSAANDAESLEAAAQAVAVVRVPNADHGWIRREADIVDAIEAWWWQPRS